MKKLCLFCCKSHKTKLPEECRIKGAVAGAMLKALSPDERYLGMLLCDKTRFLQYAYENLTKSKKGKS